MTVVGHSSRQIGSDGLNAIEREIMALWDQGQHTKADIADQLSVPLDHVHRTVSRYHVTSRNPFDEMVCQGTANLLAALQRHHPDKCGTPAGAVRS